MRGRIIAAAYLVIGMFSIAIRAVFPKGTIGGSMFDDDLFLRSAGYISQGHWLGPYDKVTLAKGFFYPLFIAVSHFLHAPLHVAEAGLNVAVSALVGVYIGRRTSSIFGVIVFAVLALNPVFWNIELARVIRENIYAPLSLAVVVLFTAALFSRRVGVAVVAGLVMAAFWMTREEGIWIGPSLIVVLIGAACNGRLRGLFVPLGAFVVCAVAPCMIVSAINYRHYGEFVTVEFKDKDFVTAYGALARINHDKWQRYVIFPADARERAYQVGGAAIELRPFLEGDNYRTWAQISCPQVGDPACKEVGAGWFMWALRDAVALSGNAKTGAQAKAFYHRLATEINVACDSGQITCGPLLPMLLPQIKSEYAGEMMTGIWPLTKLVGQFGNLNISRPQSLGNDASLAWERERMGETAPLRASHVTVSGWVAGSVPITSISIDGANFALTDASDVASAQHVMNAKRFAGEADCRGDGCRLILNGDQPVPLLRGAALVRSDLTVFIDQIMVDNRDVYPSRRIAVARWIALIYATVMPIFEVVALVGIGAGLIAAARTRKVDVILVLCVASLVACGMRVALLAFLDATSIPSINTLYSSPATPFAALFAACGIWCGFEQAKMLRRRTP